MTASVLTLIFISDKTDVLQYLSAHVASGSPMVRFIIALSAIFIMPPLSRRLKLPAVVGLLFAGILLGPHVLDIFGKERPIADFMSELGKLLLMFYAGLEVDLRLFRQSRRKVTKFGILTTSFPLVLGTLVGLWFGYAVIPAIVLGSLLASHTLLGLPIVTELRANHLEPGDRHRRCDGYVGHAVAGRVRSLPFHIPARFLHVCSCGTTRRDCRVCSLDSICCESCSQIRPEESGKS